ncbi:hypothetical protein BC03BB108_0673 [Bacillus cereus 03BB108]|nr:hypothetical protein BC03BB108_0673 [Bacillus cereus 03BB108]
MCSKLRNCFSRGSVTSFVIASASSPGDKVVTVTAGLSMLGKNSIGNLEPE